MHIQNINNEALPILVLMEAQRLLVIQSRGLPTMQKFLKKGSRTGLLMLKSFIGLNEELEVGRRCNQERDYRGDPLPPPCQYQWGHGLKASLVPSW